MTKLQGSNDEWQRLESPATLESGPKVSKDLAISTGDSLKVLRHDRALNHAVRRVPLPVIYFVVYVVMIVAHLPTSFLYKQNNALYSTLASSGDDTITSDSPMLFFNIQTTSDVFSWLKLTLVPNIFVTQDYNNNELSNDEWGRVATHNQVLGAVRFTVTNGFAMDCSDQQNFLRSIYPTCYSNDDTFENITLFSVDLNATEAANDIEAYKESGTWIDESTKKLEITVVTYNGELAAYGITKLKLEFQDGGFIELSASATGAVSSLYMSARPFVVDSLLAVCFLLVVGHQIARLRRYRANLREHLKSFWHLVDYASSVLIVAFYVLWALIAAITEESSFRTNINAFSASNLDWSADDTAADKLDNVVSSLEHIAHLTVALRLVATVTTLLLGVRILDRFRFHPRLNMLSDTISRSLVKFGAFFVVLVVVVATFALSGHFIFGDRVLEFSTIKKSLEACVNILFGNFDYSVIEGQLVPVSIIYYWGYLILGSLILLNMILAIVLDTYEEVSEEAFKDKSIASFSRIAHGIMYDTLVWCHDLPRRGCLRKGPYIFDPLDEERKTCDLSRQLVVLRGRIRPDVLEAVLEVLDDGAQEAVVITPLKLQSIFTNAQVTEGEAQGTIEYLVEGLAPFTDKGEDEHQGPATSKKQRKKNPSQPESPTFAGTDAQQLSERMAALEEKLGMLLIHIVPK